MPENQIKRDGLGRFIKGTKSYKGHNGLYKKCETCRNNFYIILSRIKSKKGKFCSLKCRRNYFLKKSKDFVLNESMAELIGVIIGDGCISKNTGRKDYRIFISGNPIEDKIYMNSYLPYLIKKCLNKYPGVYMGKNGAILVQFQNEAFRLFLKRMNIRERKTKNVDIPNVILKDKKLLLRCIKGIADTDFTLIFTKKHTNKNFYPRISAQFASFKLVRTLEKALRRMNFTVNVRYKMKIFDKRGYEWTTNQINLDGPNNLKKWMNIIGFSNKRILTRYYVWKKYGYLNPKTTLPQRLRLIQAGGGV